MVETYLYDPDGERVARSRNGVTTVYLGSSLLEEDLNPSTTRTVYTLNGQVVAQRSSSGLVYLHSDHLGSVSVATDSTGAVASSQSYTPWGDVRTGGISQTSLNYTEQRRDGAGLLYYGAHYYDPALGRFVSADSLVLGTGAGKGGGAPTLGYDAETALKPLTVDCREPEFAATLSAEHAVTQEQGFWFQLNNEEREEAKNSWGPVNPQALKRYTYVLNNPLRYPDTTGHMPCGVCAFSSRHTYSRTT